MASLGMNHYKNYVYTHKETKQVIVMARGVPAYSTIGSDAITTKTVPVDSVDSLCVNSVNEIVGKVAVTDLYKDEQIRSEKIADIEDIKDKEIISVAIDVIRAGAGWIQPGDIVDVWWLGGEDTRVPGTGNYIMSPCATVLDMKDGSGKSVFSHDAIKTGAANTTPSSPPAIAVLAVNSEHVPKLIHGAKMQNVVLVKKFNRKNKTAQGLNMGNIEPFDEKQASEGQLEGIRDAFNLGGE